MPAVRIAARHAVSVTRARAESGRVVARQFRAGARPGQTCVRSAPFSLRMPSCVVTSCKMTSEKFSKEKGVTFHLFPRLMSWQWKWTNVIRECRNQPEWLPSSFSVVCSVHFAESDIYTAKGGNRRIKKGAVPSINLYKSINITPNKKRRRRPKSTDKNASIAVQTNAELNTDRNPQNNMVFDDIESSRNSDEEMEQFIIKVEPTEDEETDEVETQTNVLDEHFIIKEEPIEESASITSSNQWTHPQTTQDFSNTAEDPNDYENELTVTKAQLNKYKRKVHLLHEKLKRSQKRNFKMKNILKEIKSRNLIDRDTFKKLTAVLFENDD